MLSSVNQNELCNNLVRLQSRDTSLRLHSIVRHDHASSLSFGRHDMSSQLFYGNKTTFGDRNTIHESYVKGRSIYGMLTSITKRLNVLLHILANQLSLFPQLLSNMKWFVIPCPLFCKLFCLFVWIIRRSLFSAGPVMCRYLWLMSDAAGKIELWLASITKIDNKWLIKCGG